MVENIFQTIDFYLNQIASIVLTVIGLIGNSLVFYILTRPKFLKESIYRYFLASEIVAAFSLLLLWLINIPILVKWDVPLIYCQIYNLLTFALFQLYPWISVLNSIDRLLSLKYPTKLKFMKELKFQILAITCLFCSFLLLSVPRFLYNTKSNLTICAISNPQAGFYMSLENLIVSNLTPFFIMILSTCLVVHYFITQKRRLEQNRINYKREKGFMKSVLTMDVWFILCYTPSCVTQFLQFTLDFTNIDENIWKLIYDVSGILIFLETSCNIFVYLCCNKLFRNYFYSMFSCCRKTVNLVSA